MLFKEKRARGRTFLEIVHLNRKKIISLWSKNGNTQTEYIMEIEENKMKSILADLERYRSEYYSASGRTRERIADNVRCYGNNLPDELYFELNQNSASGLFKPGFFESDLDRSISILSGLLAK
jgi:hypothetical protein